MAEVYLRSTVPRSKYESVATLPVVKISQTGRVSQFASNAVEGLPDDTEIFQYAFGPNGHLYEILHAVSENKNVLHLVEFSSDGKYLSKSKFPDGTWHPELFLPLPSGDFLLGASTLEDGRPAGRFTGLFGADGQMKRRFALDTKPSTTNNFEAGLSNRDAQLGPDGNIYILRRSSPASVQVVTERGDAIRSLTLTPPMANSSATEFYVTERNLFVTFQAKQLKDYAHPVQIAAYDLQDGKLSRSFYMPHRAGGIVCINGSEGTVLTHRNGYFALANTDLK